jgi:hypothetical protein
MSPQTTLFIPLLLLGSCSVKSETEVRFRERELVRIDSSDIGAISDVALSAMATDGLSWYLSFTPGGLLVKTTSGFRELARFDRPGIGPEEISDARELGISDSWVWVTDLKTLSVHRLDHELRYLDRLPLPMRPLGLFVMSDTMALVGTIDLEFEDVYRLHAMEGGPIVTRWRSRKVGAPPESMVLFAGTPRFGIHYRPFANRIGITTDSTLVSEFADPTRPSQLTYQPSMQGPIPEGKIHQTAFHWDDQACLIAGGLEDGVQFAACFDKSGRPGARIRLPSPMSLAVCKGDTLFTYSQNTHHVYRFIIGR